MRCENPFNFHTLIHKQKVDLFASEKPRQVIAIQVASNEECTIRLKPG